MGELPNCSSSGPEAEAGSLRLPDGRNVRDPDDRQWRDLVRRMGHAGEKWAERDCAWCSYSDRRQIVAVRIDADEEPASFPVACEMYCESGCQAGPEEQRPRSHRRGGENGSNCGPSPRSLSHSYANLPTFRSVRKMHGV